MPEDVRTRLQTEPVPFAGQGEQAAYRAFAEDVLPYPNGNIHPRFFGWVQGNGTPLGMMADMLGAAINPHMAGFNQAPALVEAQVIRWFIQLMGFPESASGVLALGGSMANVLGLAISRNTHAGFDVRAKGLFQSDSRLMVYTSTETHRWVVKGMEFLGLGRDSLRRIPVDTNFQIDVVLLREAIHQDRQDGHRPICIVGNAGTVNTAATDDLQKLASLCREEKLWFHVDGAFGALARLSDRLRPIVAGIEKADSMAFDFHKWMYQPFDVACLLVRDRRIHEASFSNPASYLGIHEPRDDSRRSAVCRIEHGPDKKFPCVEGMDGNESAWRKHVRKAHRAERGPGAAAGTMCARASRVGTSGACSTEHCVLQVCSRWIRGRPVEFPE